MKRWFLALLFLLLLTSVASGQVPPPPGTWARIPNTAIFPVMPPEASKCAPWLPPACGQPELWSPGAHYAYSGGDLATINGVLGLLTWGGGHADSSDNSLYFAPLDGSGPRRLSGPFLVPLGADYLVPPAVDYYEVPSRNQMDVGPGAPKARHTYDCLATVEHQGRPHFFTVGGGMASRSGGAVGRSTRLFDLTQTYAQAMARADMGWTVKAQEPSATGTCSAKWDPKTRQVIVRGRTFYGAYTPATDTWERWGDTAGGSDYETSSALDIEGRKMYVLGNHIAEIINLDTHVLTTLGTWDGTKVVGPAWVKGFVSRNLSESFATGPGLAWHPGRKRLIVYPYYHLPGYPNVEGEQQNLLQIDPVTGTVEPLLMGGIHVITRPTYAFFGRFQLIPGTDTVVLAGRVDLDLYVGQLPARGGVTPPPPVPTPPPSPPPPRPPSSSPPTRPSGSAPSPGTVWVTPGNPIPVRQWIERLNGFAGSPSSSCNPSSVWVAEACGLAPGKHTRVFYHPGLKGLVQAGGDHAVGMSFPGPYDSTGSEILLYQPGIEKWTTLRPFCVRGEPQPARPDNVIWALDAKRNRAIMAPGFYGGVQWEGSPGFTRPAGVSGCGALDGYGAYAFDFTTMKYIGPDDPNVVTLPPTGRWPGDNGGTYGVVDPVKDELVFVHYPIGLQHMNLATKRWRTMPLTVVHAFESQQVIDVQGRVFYYIAPNGLRTIGADGNMEQAPLLVKVFLDDPNGRQEFIKTPWPMQSYGSPFLAFDPGNRVIFVPNNLNYGGSLAGLGIYHVDTGVWEWEDVPPEVAASLYGFDENTGLLVGMGKRSVPYATYLYKYGGAIKPLPVQPPLPPVQATAILNESFNRPPASGLGPDQPWTVVEGKFKTEASGGAPVPLPGGHAQFVGERAVGVQPHENQLIWSSARVEKDLPSSDMEVWLTNRWLESGGGYLHELAECVAARFDPTAATYYAVCLGMGEGSHLRIIKVVKGVRTILGPDPEMSARITDQPIGAQIRIRVTGTTSVTITAFYRGKILQQVVDSAADRIAQGTRAGLAGQGMVGRRANMDDWRAGVSAVTP